jgi:putative RNA 2'-phosphotransferase
MDERNLTSTSKFLSYVLRHHPESINLSLDKNGWAEIAQLIHKAEQHGKKLDRTIINEILEHSEKQRFIISDDGKYIRAGYGHSIDVDLQMKPKEPPSVLYHGTAQRNMESILEEGIVPGSRNFVNLSAMQKHARNIGSRHGPPVILQVKAVDMSQSGYSFYQSESEASIWLTKRVPVKYICSDPV